MKALYALFVGTLLLYGGSHAQIATGGVIAQYVVEGLRRPSGLAWVNDALWIAEFGGQIWRLPFVQ